MLWLIRGEDQSDSIVGCNIFTDSTKPKTEHQLWVTRTNGKTTMIDANEDKGVVQEIKDAIDYAIETGEPALRIK